MEQFIREKYERARVSRRAWSIRSGRGTGGGAAGHTREPTSPPLPSPPLSSRPPQYKRRASDPPISAAPAAAPAAVEAESRKAKEKREKKKEVRGAARTDGSVWTLVPASHAAAFLFFNSFQTFSQRSRAKESSNGGGFANFAAFENTAVKVSAPPTQAAAPAPASSSGEQEEGQRRQ